ncbi:Uncharacterised protein [Starkeya nomas]|uniref:Uncharacterized protein n=1 Tax=Starkeya nomas TaxID=2666134 RepID=A0A5S9NWN8_9HYPH|nr:hypothetical protein [Starkeya nomas]CAA0095009.1 Uncharacterised protein [Starkeya nomas]
MKRLMTTICEPLISALLGRQTQAYLRAARGIGIVFVLVFGYCQIRGIPFSEERFALITAVVALAEAYVAQARQVS